ncbi:CidA/LrgA family protein [Rhizobium sp. CAU 1783]
MRKIACRLAGLAIVAAAWWVGEFLVRSFGVPFSGPVLGLGCLFLAFSAFPALVDAAAPACRILLDNFPLFLFPLGAGFLTLGNLGALDLAKISVAVAISLVLSLVVGAVVFRLVKHRHG